MVLHLFDRIDIRIWASIWYRLHDLYLSLSSPVGIDLTGFEDCSRQCISFLLRDIERLVRPVCHIIGFLQSVPWGRWWKSDLSVEKMLLFLGVLLSVLCPDTLRFRMSYFLEACYQMLISIDDYSLNHLICWPLIVAVSEFSYFIYV